MELSKRLAAVAGLVSAGRTAADIGTDHGYIPIYLVESGICPKAFAMDVRKGPLERAREHITGHGLGNYIEMRLSDGLSALTPGEADCMIAAGMGGNLIIRILEEGREALSQMEECILQPQSEITKVRAYLETNGYVSVREDMVYEDGKYYPMMKMQKASGAVKAYTEMEYRYGRLLLEQKHPVLKEFLEREVAGKEKILRDLAGRPGSRIREREEELRAELLLAQEAYAQVTEE